MNQQKQSLSAAGRPGYAFFFDVDGTLAAIQPQPEQVSVPASVCQHLALLAACCDGALALVSGRPIQQLDALFAPQVLPAAGIHGAERRNACGDIQRLTLPPALLSTLTASLETALAALPGTRLENKGIAFALHYRQAPQHRQAIEQLAAKIVAGYPQLMLQPGKCVVELKPAGASKGAAIRAFMQQPPFAGRIPVFLGDDVTDEAGFREVNAMQGISIKVGEGASDAHGYLADVDAVHQWLARTQLQLQHGVAAPEEPKL